MQQFVNEQIAQHAAVCGTCSREICKLQYKEYIEKYGQFFLVGNSNEFAKLVKVCKEQELEYFAVVLYDDIEFIDIIDSCFGSTQEHPFRGLFDGNGYALCIRSISVNKRASGIFGYISENAIVKNFKILNAFVRDKALLIDDNVLTVTVNESTNLISLNSIKRGAGDVNIGIWAGLLLLIFLIRQTRKQCCQYLK